MPLRNTLLAPINDAHVVSGIRMCLHLQVVSGCSGVSPVSSRDVASPDAVARNVQQCEHVSVLVPESVGR
jgi:hypothetical protein